MLFIFFIFSVLGLKTGNLISENLSALQNSQSAERVNGALKDNHGGRNVRVKDEAKVYTYLMFGILVIAAEQILRLVG